MLAHKVLLEQNSEMFIHNQQHAIRALKGLELKMLVPHLKAEWSFVFYVHMG